MNVFDNALELAKAQAWAVNEAAQAMSGCVGAVMEASAAFARSNTERNMEFAATLMGAKTLENAAEIHGAFVRDSVRASGAMAIKLTDACTQAAKECSALAAAAANGPKGSSES